MKEPDDKEIEHTELEENVSDNEESPNIDDNNKVHNELEQEYINDIIEEDKDFESEIEVNQKEDLGAQKSEELDLQMEIIHHHKNLIEGALYASGSPLDIEELSVKLEISKKEVEDLVNQLALEYLERSGALIIAQVGDRFQMQLRPEYTEQVSKFAKGGGISEANLRTLTIIALKQPILKSTLVKIRGTGAYEHVKYLFDNELISAVKKGRTQELTTTDKYADMFGLPKNKQELKKMMISQLGLNEGKED